MSDTVNTQEQQAVEVTTIGSNPFSETSWAEQPPVQPEQQQSITSNTLPAEGTTSTVATTTSTTEEEIVDPNIWLKEQLGYETVESAKREIEELRKLRETAQTQAQIKFANEQSEKFFEALRDGKEDDVYHYLNQKRSLERLEKLELKGVQEAAEIIKANLQFKHKDLTTDEINFLYNKRYSIPAKPTQGVDQDDTDFAIELEGWQQTVKEKEQEMIIEAKLARPDLVKFKSELVLPDIPKTPSPSQQPAEDPELEAKAVAFKAFVFGELDKKAPSFSGFNVTYKDEAVEIPIAFKMTDEDRASTLAHIKEKVIGEHYNFNDYFNDRWFDEKGTPRVEQMIRDVYLMDHAEKVFQKVANESATKRLEHKLKEASNIRINQTPQGTFSTQTAEGEFDKMASHFWSQ